MLAKVIFFLPFVDAFAHFSVDFLFNLCDFKLVFQKVEQQFVLVDNVVDFQKALPVRNIHKMRRAVQKRHGFFRFVQNVVNVFGCALAHEIVLLDDGHTFSSVRLRLDRARVQFFHRLVRSHEEVGIIDVSRNFHFFDAVNDNSQRFAAVRDDLHDARKHADGINTVRLRIAFVGVYLTTQNDFSVSVFNGVGNRRDRFFAADVEIYRSIWKNR